MIFHLKRYAPLFFYYATGIVGLRNDDVILASFPKSGNTWVRFFFCNIISLEKWSGQEVGFPVLDRTMPEIGVTNLIPKWPYKDLFPRIVKTHWPNFFLFRNNKSVLIVRDPRDVMVSYYRFVTQRKRPLFSGSFSDFIKDHRFGLPFWFRYHNSWLNNSNTTTIYYEELRQDDIKYFKYIINQIGANISQELIERAAQSARIEQVQKNETKHGPSDPAKLKDRKFSFTEGGGTQGKWKNWFSERDLEYYKLLFRKNFRSEYYKYV